MAKRWTDEERQAWAKFLDGELMFPPGDRSMSAVMERLRGDPDEDDLRPWIGSVSSDVLHRVSMAALGMLRNLPHRRANQLKDFVDAVVHVAVGDVGSFFNPDVAGARFETLQAIPDDELHRAILAARAAYRAAIAAGLNTGQAA